MMDLQTANSILDNLTLGHVLDKFSCGQYDGGRVWGDIELKVYIAVKTGIISYTVTSDLSTGWSGKPFKTIEDAITAYNNEVQRLQDLQ